LLIAARRHRHLRLRNHRRQRVADRHPIAVRLRRNLQQISHVLRTVLDRCAV
jgi:hypothetical protein